MQRDEQGFDGEEQNVGFAGLGRAIECLQCLRNIALADKDEGLFGVIAGAAAGGLGQAQLEGLRFGAEAGTRVGKAETPEHCRKAVARSEGFLVLLDRPLVIPESGVAGAEGNYGRGQTGLQAEHTLVLFHCFADASREVKDDRQVWTCGESGIEIGGAAGLGDRLIETAVSCEAEGVPLVRRRKAGVEFDGAAQFTLCARPIMVVEEEDPAKNTVRFGVVLIELNRFQRGMAGPTCRECVMCEPLKS